MSAACVSVNASRKGEVCSPHSSSVRRYAVRSGGDFFSSLPLLLSPALPFPPLPHPFTCAGVLADAVAPVVARVWHDGSRLSEVPSEYVVPAAGCSQSCETVEGAWERRRTGWISDSFIFFAVSSAASDASFSATPGGVGVGLSWASLVVCPPAVSSVMAENADGASRGTVGRVQKCLAKSLCLDAQTEVQQIPGKWSSRTTVSAMMMLECWIKGSASDGVCYGMVSHP